ncbi:MAG: hypothetical protein AB4041_16045 [Microcystaceae cyanobacterium]
MTNPDSSPSSESNETSETSQSPVVKSVELTDTSFNLIDNPTEISDDIDRFTLTPKQQETRFNNRVTAYLGLGFGVILALVIVGHFRSVIYINIWSIKSPEEIDLGTSNINNTANTIYSFLTTLVTAATGYYFTTFNRYNNSDNNENS